MAESRALFLKEVKLANTENLPHFCCPVCYDTFLLPKFLPRCGHTFCQRCLSSLVDNTNDWTGLSCPECRTISELGEDGVRGLKTNVAVEKAINGLCQNRSKKCINDIDECPHELVASAMTTCPHCDMLFCDGCLCRHIEMLRLEINWLSIELELRSGKAVQIMFEAFCKKVGKLEPNEEKGAASYSMVGEEALGHYQQQQEQQQHRSKEGEAFIKSPRFAEIRQHLQSYGLKEKVSALNKKPLTYCSIEEVDQLHETLVKHDIGCGYLFLVLLNDSLELNLGVPQAQLCELELTQFFANVGESDMHKMIQVLPYSYRLHMFARVGDLEQLKDLIAAVDKKAKVCKPYIINHKDKEEHYRTILHQATEQNHIEMVKFLVLEQNADIFAVDMAGGSMPFHFAAMAGHLEIVKFFLDFRADLLEAVNICGDTMLSLAAETGQLSVVEYLVNEKGANIENKCFFKSTPVSYAACEGHLPVVVFLTRAGADICVRDKYGVNENTPIHWAAQFGHVDIVEYLLSVKPELIDCENGCESHNKIIHVAASQGQVDVVKFLVENQKVDIEMRNGYNWTPLFAAATENEVAVVEYLIEKGADVMAKADDESLAIHSAAFYGCTKVVECLLEAKPDLIDAEDADGDTPLMLALQQGHSALAELLESRGANTDGF